MQLTEILTPHNVEIPAHLAADAEVPVCHGLVRQGDILVIPTKSGAVANLVPIPAEGIAVVRGEAGGNTHLLVGSGHFAQRNQGTDCGTLVVGEGETAWLIHPEHGGQGIGTGSYLIRRQREQREALSLVHD